MDYHQVNEWEDEWIKMVKDNVERVYVAYGGATGNDGSEHQPQTEIAGGQADYFMRQVYGKSRNERRRRIECELDVYLREGREYSTHPLQW